jgi:hypothetical protein
MAKLSDPYKYAGKNSESTYRVREVTPSTDKPRAKAAKSAANRDLRPYRREGSHGAQ